MRLLTTFTLLTICLTTIGQTIQTYDKRKKTLTYYPGTYIDTESRYTDSTGIVVIIQNSLPKGGSYTDSTGKNFGYRIFWYRVINETSAPLELTINFPADSFAILSSPDYLKVFLPSDTMTLDKETLYSYGATGLISFLDTGLTKPTMLQRTINPKEACLFYIGALFTQGYGAARAGLVLKEQDLFYRIRGIAPDLDSALIPCGQIVFKN
jgi:hypothetical protein